MKCALQQVKKLQNEKESICFFKSKGGKPVLGDHKIQVSSLLSPNSSANTESSETDRLQFKSLREAIVLQKEEQKKKQLQNLQLKEQQMEDINVQQDVEKNNLNPVQKEYYLNQSEDKSLDYRKCSQVTPFILENLYQQEQSLILKNPEIQMFRLHNELSTSVRKILVNWIILECEKLRFSSECLFTSIQLIDRFLMQSDTPVIAENFQKLGAASLYISLKFENNECIPVEALQKLTDQGAKGEEIIEWESKIVQIIDFQFNIPTPFVFLKLFIDQFQFQKLTQMISQLLCESILYFPHYMQYPNSQLAAACCYVAYSFTQKKWIYNSNFEQITGCKRQDVEVLKRKLLENLLLIYKYSNNNSGEDVEINNIYQSTNNEYYALINKYNKTSYSQASSYCYQNLMNFLGQPK